MNQSELIEKVSRATELNQRAAGQAVKAVVDAILDSLVAGEAVRVSGLGTFNLAARPARQGRNPPSGQTIQIAASDAGGDHLVEAPSELDHTTTNPGVTGSGKPLFASASATFVRRTRQAGIARHRPAVTHPPGEHLKNEHICRLNADPDDTSQQPHLGLWLTRALRLF